jgi:hypothetical protein
MVNPLIVVTLLVVMIFSHHDDSLLSKKMIDPTVLTSLGHSIFADHRPGGGYDVADADHTNFFLCKLRPNHHIADSVDYPNSFVKNASQLIKASTHQGLPCHSLSMFMYLRRLKSPIIKKMSSPQMSLQKSKHFKNKQSQASLSLYWLDGFKTDLHHTKQSFKVESYMIAKLISMV